MLDPSFVFAQALSGLTAAMFLFLIASGLSLIFGVLRVLNFAHGTFYMLGAYAAYQLVQWLGTGGGRFWLAALGLLGTIGFVAVWRRWRALALYGICYGGLILIWVFNQDRFLAPVLPFVIVIVAAGAWQVGRLLMRNRAWVPVAGLAIVLSISGLAAQARFIRHRLLCDRSVDPPTLGCLLLPEWASFVAAARYAQTALPAGTAVVVGKDASFAYLSGHPVVPGAALVGTPPDSVGARMREVGLFVADTWRWKPNLTLNLGLRYELQMPFYPLNNSYSTATMADICGISGVASNGSCNLFQPGVLTGRAPAR